MYVVLLHFTAPKTRVDERLVEHHEWVNQHYEAGDFICAGTRESEDGVVIIARAMSRGRLDALLATDPFVLHKLARYEVIPFEVRHTIPELANYADSVRSSSQ
ncbi:YciI family protein [Salinifilum ghardaiensis]